MYIRIPIKAEQIERTADIAVDAGPVPFPRLKKRSL
jgi:hypothetical protein